jgi:hypothetical protein
MADKPKPGMPGKSIAELNIEVANKVANDYSQAARAPQGKPFVMPGGMIHDATPYLESAYKMGEDATLYGDIGKYVTADWQANHPGFQFAWPMATDPMLPSRIRQGLYIYVSKDDLVPDCPVPYFETIGTAGAQAIQVKDTICVAMSPQAYDRLFKRKEYLGVRAVVGEQEAFYAGVDQEGGRAEMWEGGTRRGPAR